MNGRKALILCMVLLISACPARGVKPLSLRDPRLPPEARGALADAEDEVSIARARVDDAEKAERQLADYADQWEVQLERMRKAGSGAGAGESLEQACTGYARERAKLKKAESTLARDNLELSRARLTLVQARTAVQLDLAVYELEPLARGVDRRREGLKEVIRAAEQQKARADQAADACWAAYAAYVAAGGQTQALWLIGQ